jgi:hypothetical protein
LIASCDAFTETFTTPFDAALEVFLPFALAIVLTCSPRAAASNVRAQENRE